MEQNLTLAWSYWIQRTDTVASRIHAYCDDLQLCPLNEAGRRMKTKLSTRFSSQHIDQRCRNVVEQRYGLIPRPLIAVCHLKGDGSLLMGAERKGIKVFSMHVSGITQSECSHKTWWHERLRS